MIFPKGGGTAESAFLFGKYQICRIIGKGRSGTVYLVRHLGLCEYRAVKQVAKESGSDFSKEALLLKSLKHPGIPIIYDLEEDPNYYYLIEEYLDGESLFSLLKRQGNLTRAKVISYGIELCQIMVYLHSLQPYPILYLDLQPKNLILCDGTLKLIDFDQAVTAAFAGNLKKRYGTAGCAAPEQFTDEPLDARTDIYAIGALLYYMGTGAFPEGDESVSGDLFGEELAAVIRQCLMPSRDERYQDAKSLLGALLKLGGGDFNNKISLLKFAVVGSSHGMGVTHVSLGLSSYLSMRGIDNLYLEKHEPGCLRTALGESGFRPDVSGIYHVKCWDLKPGYGRCVRLKTPEHRAEVLDFGTDLEAAAGEENCAFLLLICGGKWWESEQTRRALEFLQGTEQLRIGFNYLFEGGKPAVFPADTFIPCYRLPLFSNPERRNREADQFFDELFRGTESGADILEEDGGRNGRKRNGEKQLNKRWRSSFWQNRKRKNG